MLHYNNDCWTFGIVAPSDFCIEALFSHFDNSYSHVWPRPLLFWVRCVCVFFLREAESRRAFLNWSSAFLSALLFYCVLLYGFTISWVVKGFCFIELEIKMEIDYTELPLTPVNRVSWRSNINWRYICHKKFQDVETFLKSEIMPTYFAPVCYQDLM